MALDWDDFRLLLAVAKSGSASGAGRSLGINQSTVSRRISALEQRVEVRLFEPLPSGLALTAAGEEVLAAAERMEREVEQLDRQVWPRRRSLRQRPGHGARNVDAHPCTSRHRIPRTASGDPS